MRIRVVVAALVLPIVLATACGDDGGDAATDPEPTAESSTPPIESSPSEPTEPAEPVAPPCAEVWVDGGTLPKPYVGCAEDDVTVPPDALDCSSGQKIIRYAERFFAVPGGMIRETDGLERDDDYLDSIATCRG